MKRTRFPLVISITERALLRAIAAQHGVSQAATFRRLLRQEAHRLGLTVGDEIVTVLRREDVVPSRPSDDYKTLSGLEQHL